MHQPSSLVMRSAYKPAVVNKRKGFKDFLWFYIKIKKLDGLAYEDSHKYYYCNTTAVL